MSTSVGNLAAELMRTLEEYADLTTESMKAAVDRAGKTIRDEIKAGAPVSRGKYAKSWRTKTTDESSTKKEATVHSTIPGLPHLVEHGHAKRNGGRTRAIVHIAPAEEHGIEQLEEDIERAIRNG